MQVNDVHYSAPISVEVDMQDKSDLWLAVFQKNVESSLQAMADATLSRARMTVPRKNGYLSESGRTDGSGLERYVIFGNQSVRYAGYQERGMAYDGSRIVRHYTTPGTGSRYLQNAFKSVLGEGIQRFLK